MPLRIDEEDSPGDGLASLTMIFGGEKCLWLRSGVDSDENDHMTLMLLVVFVSVVNVAAAAAPSENGNHTFWQYQVTLRTRRDELLQPSSL